MSISKYEYEKALAIVAQYEAEGHEDERWGYEALCEYKASLNPDYNPPIGCDPWDDEIWQACFEDWQKRNPNWDPSDFDIADYIDHDPYSPTYGKVARL